MGAFVLICGIHVGFSLVSDVVQPSFDAQMWTLRSRPSPHSGLNFCTREPVQKHCQGSP
jgi:hypothetical protein